VCALVRTVSGVPPLVALERILIPCPVFTPLALIGFLARVLALMQLEVAFAGRLVPANLTYVRLEL